jgi:hypothetical protein
LTWTLESELAGLAGESDIGAALRSLSLVASDEVEAELEPGAGWERGGAETYIYDFWVSSPGNREHFLLKACVAIGDFSGVSSILGTWLERRAVLEAAGVSVPRLHGAGSGTILEEFVPFSVRECLKSSSDSEHLAHRLGKLAAVLAKLKFPVLSLSDLRSHGNDVVVVDFGEDLGSPGFSGLSESMILDEAIKLLDEVGDKVKQRVLIQEVSASFEAGVV